ncbi:hypothetical protein OUZ56_009896 [Daphnia magna]|uniref:Uncharacterized protein n=1 Tax=Daphnia magna TaxID=35525 RepID=A0ABR0AHC4_9CRUS|nr:hypothetical protein OUZ56_009896 [Daphnia magna]
MKLSSNNGSGHFEEDDIIKGRLLKGKDGKELFYAWNNWSLKEGPILRIFPGYHISFSNCPSYLNKPKSAKRKLPKGRQSANKRNRTDCNQKTEKEYLLMMIVILPCTTHGCHLNLKTVPYLQLGFGFTQMMGLSTALNPEDTNKFGAGAVLQNDTWRSIHCKPVFSAITSSNSPSEEVLKGVNKNIEMGTPTCYECYTMRRALNMEKEIAAIEAQEHILMLEKRQMAAELIVKQGNIDLQAVELLQVRTEFAEQANKVKESE